jgi:multiple sugar transport system permease protein
MTAAQTSGSTGSAALGASTGVADPDRPAGRSTAPAGPDGSGPTRARRLGAASGPTGVLSLIGGVLLLISFLGLDWFAGGFTVSRLGSVLSLNGTGPFAAIFFGGLGWALVALTLVAAVVAHVPSLARRVPAGPAATLPAVRLALALVGFVASFVALQLTTASSYGYYLGQAGSGFWLAAIGFAFLAVAAIGSRLDARLTPLTPLLWIGPALGLIGFVVITPVVMMFRTAFRKIDTVGFDHGWTGSLNFRQLFDESQIGSIILRTIAWVVAIVVLTVVISLALAQLFNQVFPGRRVARWALIAPWAASVFMTAVIFRWMLNAGYGVINLVLHDLGLVHHLGSGQADWLARPTAAFWWMVAVAVFVSVPFTTYAILAGLQTVPGDVYEAARVDGAGTWRTYFSITLPLLRPALIVAVLINLMNVFNNFPIIWEMRKGAAGYDTDTTTTFMYKLKSSSIGESAAMSVVNFGFVLVIVGVFLFTTNRRNREATK